MKKMASTYGIDLLSQATMKRLEQDLDHTRQELEALTRDIQSRPGGCRLLLDHFTSQRDGRW
jgi:hypothetical protein